MSIIGQSVTRVDAVGKVTGQAQYPGDINLPEQAHMKILFAHRPHAIIRSIDTRAAEALPGVIAVFTAKDVPVNEYGLIVNDQPVLCGPGSSKPFADRVRFVGDQVALVVAESEAIAAQGRDLIRVDYEDLPVVTDPLAARQEGATLLYPDLDSNVFVHYRIRTGDAEAALAQALETHDPRLWLLRGEPVFAEAAATLGLLDAELADLERALARLSAISG